MMDSTLVLNKGGIPVSVVSWQRAVALICAERAIALENYKRDLHSSGGRIVMSMPSVIQCTDSDFVPKRFTSTLPFSRKNVYIRDGGRCMYCGKKVGLSSFTFDHVKPRCAGGESCWTNVVVSCMRCNSKKGSRHLERSGLNLIRKPYAPRLDKAAPSHLVSKIAGEIPHESWSDYVYWNIILEP